MSRSLEVCQPSRYCFWLGVRRQRRKKQALLHQERRHRLRSRLQQHLIRRQHRVGRLVRARLEDVQRREQLEPGPVPRAPQPEGAARRAQQRQGGVQPGRLPDAARPGQRAQVEDVARQPVRQRGVAQREQLEDAERRERQRAAAELEQRPMRAREALQADAPEERRHRTVWERVPDGRQPCRARCRPGPAITSELTGAAMCAPSRDMA